MPLRSKFHQLVASALTVILFAGLPLFISPVQAQAPQWVHTWIAPPSTLPPDANALENPSSHIENQTLRLIAHTSVGGDKLRLRIANTHGETLLRVAGVTVALQENGDQIQSNTLTTVTFTGKNAVMVPRGAVMLSDSIEFKVPAEANLSISLFFDHASPFVTSHFNANQTAWLAPGNQLAAKQLKDSTTRTTWDFVTAVEVQTKDNVHVIAAVGDSITDGYLSTINDNNRWPNYLARRLRQELPKRQFAVLNAGISGNRVLRETSPRFGENLLARMDRDVFSIQHLQYIVLLEGINDIGMGSRDPSQAVSAEDLINGYRQVIARAHAKDIKVFGATLLPYQGAAYFSDAGELIRQQVNQWIRTSGEFDGVVDFEGAVRDPQLPSQIRRDFTKDNLHPNDAGYQAMAEAIDLTFFTP